MHSDVCNAEVVTVKYMYNNYVNYIDIIMYGYIQSPLGQGDSPRLQAVTSSILSEWETSIAKHHIASSD